jgi:hypothetical protein
MTSSTFDSPRVTTVHRCYMPKLCPIMPKLCPGSLEATLLRGRRNSRKSNRDHDREKQFIQSPKYFAA